MSIICWYDWHNNYLTVTSTWISWVRIQFAFPFLRKHISQWYICVLIVLRKCERIYNSISFHDIGMISWYPWETITNIYSIYYIILGHHGIINRGISILNSSSTGQNGRRSTDDIFQCIFVNEVFVFWFQFHWSLFLRVQLALREHWLR